MNDEPATTIFFDGQPTAAYPGDTVASALYRAGQRIFSRSFKYHRPRGLLCGAGRCPNCLVNVDGTPNVRACTEPVRAGMQVRHQNAYPSLERDWLAVAERFDWLMPVGFYYKTFTHPTAWRFVEPLICRVAGLGEVADHPPAASLTMHLATSTATSIPTWRLSVAARPGSKPPSPPRSRVAA